MLILFIVLFFQQRRVITNEMTHFNSEYSYDKEVPKASRIFVSWTAVYCYGLFYGLFD